MHKRILLFIILVMVGFAVNAKQVSIRGNAKSYAGELLRIKCYEDQISYKEKELDSCRVDVDGNFQFQFELKETIMSFIHLYVFKGILYIEPGKDYEIVLPKKVVKLPEDELNPFFEEEKFYIRILNQGENELNPSIDKFIKYYNACIDKYFYLYKGRLEKVKVDSIITALDKSFAEVENPFFKDFKDYSYLSLRMMAYERNKGKLIEHAFYKKPILYENPAYMDLFNQVFSNFLADYSQTRQGEKIPYYLIKDKSLVKIKMALSDTVVLQEDNLQDLIIIKSLLENFYKEDYPKESIIFMMDSLKNASKAPENRKIACNVIGKITSLLVQYPAPDFELPDMANKILTLSDFKGKFVYLNIINANSYSCLQDLEVLKKMASKKYDMLEIVTICVCNKIEDMQKLVKEKSYNWKFLFYSNQLELLKNYNVRAYPTYYLINPESCLVMSPAFPPTEASFEARYADMLKAWKREVQKRKTKGLQH
jgi:hypothetical protein